MNTVPWRGFGGHGLNSCVPLLVTLILTLFTAPRAGATAPSSSPLQLAFKAQGQQTANSDAETATYMNAALEYTFVKSYSLGLDASYWNTLNDTKVHTGRGIADVTATLNDKELWRNKYYDWTLKGAIGFIAPTSESSKMATMQYGFLQKLELKKGFGDRFNITTSASLTEYSFYYDTAYESDTDVIYNTRWRLANRLAAAYDILKVWHVTVGATYLTYNNINDQTYNIAMGDVSTSVDIVDGSSLDFGMRVGYKSGGAPPTWYGPVVSDKLFGSEGVLFFAGVSFKI